MRFNLNQKTNGLLFDVLIHPSLKAGFFHRSPNQRRASLYRPLCSGKHQCASHIGVIDLFIDALLVETVEKCCDTVVSAVALIRRRFQLGFNSGSTTKVLYLNNPKVL